jgi:hypothetical protein
MNIFPPYYNNALKYFGLVFLASVFVMVFLTTILPTVPRPVDENVNGVNWSNDNINGTQIICKKKRCVSPSPTPPSIPSPTPDPIQPQIAENSPPAAQSEWLTLVSFVTSMGSGIGFLCTLCIAFLKERRESAAFKTDNERKQLENEKLALEIEKLKKGQKKKK